MDTEKKDIKGITRKRLVAFLIAVTVILLYYTVMQMVSPAKTMRQLKKEHGYVQDEKNPVNDSIFTDSAYLALFREVAFLKARTAMAENDSIYLSLNLADSTVNLEITGVTVAKTRIISRKESRIFRDRYSYIISSLLSKPLTITRNFASIPKEPLMIKMAPKDTSEFKPDIIPDTADYEPVNFIIETDAGIVVYAYQEERLNPGDRLHLFFFDLRYRIHSAWQDMKKIFTFRVPDYHMYVRMRLTRDDAKIIYRALPEQGQIAIYR
ncbi:MAG: hypothetical protein MUE74_10850 [Bacteroidales bacterium]|jgi:hypothetical protein|nr:hypothetical protein [Bacteroidales bacterium]